MRKIDWRAASAAGIVSLALTGCGGGGSSGGLRSSAGAGSVSDIGPFTTRSTTASPLQAVTSSAAGPVFTGISGGAFSSIVLNPQQDLDNSRILFSRQGAIYSMDRFGGSVKPISTDVNTSGSEARATWSPDRLRIAYAHQLNGMLQIYTANADGSNPTVISSGTASELEPAWSPTGSKIAFTRFDSTLGFNQIYTRNTDGSGITRLSDKTTRDEWPSWSPDGSKIVFQRINLTTFMAELYIMNANGTGLTPFLSSTTNLTRPAWSPDGKSIAYSANGDVFTTSVANPGNIASIATSADDELEPTWSPDGKYIAYKRVASSGWQIWVADVNGQSPTEITFPGSGVFDAIPVWSPPPVKKTIVGTGGSLGASAAGFLFGMDGNKLTSVLTFDSATPDAATVTTNENPDPGAHDIVFNVSGSLNSIKFFNVDASSVTVLPSGGTTSATGAVVIFNATTGQVATVIPLSASRAASTHSTEPGIYRGTFLGVFDASGHNLAPNGASVVRTEVGTGRVLSIQ